MYVAVHLVSKYSSPPVQVVEILTVKPQLCGFFKQKHAFH